MKAAWLIPVCCIIATASPTTTRPAEPHPLEGVHRVVFLGDSITYAGEYIAFTEAILRVKQPALRCEFLDLGLPSETVSGLSEPGHAGGQFPRPDLHERLDRVLRQTKPDLIVACYGMNDGIYYPFGEDRFSRFKEGMEFLRERAKAGGARVLHLTPPVFDPLPIRERTLPAGLAEYRQPYEGYNDVLDRYAEWLIGQRSKGWDVVDVHGPLKRYLAEQRARDPRFRLADDGVHMNATGHWLMARELLQHWGVPATELAGESGEQALAALPRGAEILKLVSQRQTVMKDAWLSATGHRRPGMSRGLPPDEARRRGQEIESRILRLQDAAP
ncbi:MAG: SGNH/GDSL hydrolase family protein [Isosphaeraceae bacterium]